MLPRVLALCLLAGAAAAETPFGTWVGRYVCAQGETALTLAIEAAEADGLRALFRFAATPENPFVPTGCFVMEGTFDATSGRVELRAGAWRKRPPGFVTIGLDGHVRGDAMEGRAVGPGCTTFALRHDGEARPLPDCAGPALLVSG